MRVDTLRGSADLKLFQDFGELQLFDVDGKTTNFRGELAPVSWCVPQISRRVKWIQYQGQSRKILHRRSDGIVEFNGGMMNIDRRPKFNGNYRVRTVPVGSVLAPRSQTPMDRVMAYAVPTGPKTAQVGLWYGPPYRLTGKLEATQEMLAQAWLIHLGFLEDRLGKKDIDGVFGRVSQAALDGYWSARGKTSGPIEQFLSDVSSENPNVSPWCVGDK